MNTELRISLGVVSDTIATQLNRQGLKYSPKRVEQFESYRDSLNHLSLNGLLNDKELANIRGKIFTRIKAHVVEQNKIESSKAIDKSNPSNP